jgi:hypothetical protein
MLCGQPGYGVAESQPCCGIWFGRGFYSARLGSESYKVELEVKEERLRRWLRTGVGGGGDDDLGLLGKIASSSADEPWVEDGVVPRAADGTEAREGDERQAHEDLLQELMGEGFPERRVKVGIVEGFAFAFVVTVLVGAGLGRDWHFFGLVQELPHKLAPSHGLINPPSLTYGPSNVLRNCGPRQFTATNEQYMAHGSLHGSEHNSTGQLWPLLSSLKNLCVVFD